MDQFQGRQSYRPFFQSDSSGFREKTPPQLVPPGVPPPPLPPPPLSSWFNQPNSGLPPPPVPLSFLPHQFAPNYLPSHDFTYSSPQLFPGNPSSSSFPNSSKQHFYSAVPQGMRPEVASTIKLSRGQAEVDGWIANIRKRNIRRSDDKDFSSNDIKIRDMRRKVNDVLAQIRELDNDSKTLGVMVKTVTAAEWESKCAEIEEKKVRVVVSEQIRDFRKKVNVGSVQEVDSDSKTLGVMVKTLTAAEWKSKFAEIEEKVRVLSVPEHLVNYTETL